MVSSIKEEWHARSRFGLSCRTVHTHRALVAATSVIEAIEVATGGSSGGPVRVKLTGQWEQERIDL